MTRNSEPRRVSADTLPQAQVRTIGGTVVLNNISTASTSTVGFVESNYVNILTSMNYGDDAGVSGKIVVEKDMNAEKDNSIGPRLYFSYVKSRLNEHELKELKARVRKLTQMTFAAEEGLQQGLYEELSMMLAISVRESEAYACGYRTWLHRRDIDRFKERVREKPVRLEKLENFPRPIPKKTRGVIQDVMAKGLFDEMWVLYTDYVDAAPIKTTKEKIREKDPVLFGKFHYSPDVFYYVADWVDEHCDITLTKIFKELSTDDPEYALNEIPEMTAEQVARIKEEVLRRTKRLADTRVGNWRQQEADEAGEQVKPKAKAAKKSDGLVTRVIDAVRGKKK